MSTNIVVGRSCTTTVRFFFVKNLKGYAFLLRVRLGLGIETDDLVIAAMLLYILTDKQQHNSPECCAAFFVGTSDLVLVADWCMPVFYWEAIFVPYRKPGYVRDRTSLEKVGKYYVIGICASFLVFPTLADTC